MVYDDSVLLPGCDWTKAHLAQGFARRESVVNFNTLLEWGQADVAVSIGVYEPQAEYQRVIAVPFRVTSGKVIVHGPEETVPRSLSLAPGDYRLVAAQYVSGDDEEVIDLWFEPRGIAAERSSILVADAALNPSVPLVETSKIAGER
jgi:hypothetical protein